MATTPPPPDPAPPSRDYPAHPLCAALALVVRDGKVLLVRRGKLSHPDKWGFPGGLIELGESIFDAALRELAEETGVTAHPLVVEDAIPVIVHDLDGRVKSHFVLVAVRCLWEKGDASPASDVAETGWFTLAQIAAMDCHPQVDQLAARILADT